jgi:N6-L-threonylcarbamoyladenine synthase
MNNAIYILAIESSCDETSAAVLCNQEVLSNIIAGQDVHREYGGVVPELASRAHQQNIIPVVDSALKRAGIKAAQLNAIAFTRGPGLLGSLLVGTAFAKSYAMALNIPLIEVDHVQAHVLAHFIDGQHPRSPHFPFLCLTVSGGHTQIELFHDHFRSDIIGKTIDDAAGEAFDKAAKIMGLPYPGGPVIDKLAKDGDVNRFHFSKPNIPGYDFSYSGLKTSFLYFIRDALKTNADFIEQNKADLCASIQNTIVEILIDKVMLAVRATGVSDVALAGGVSANSYLRSRMKTAVEQINGNLFVPKMAYTTDNAAMIGIAAFFKYQQELFAAQDSAPYSRASAR